MFGVGFLGVDLPNKTHWVFWINYRLITASVCFIIIVIVILFAQ